MKQGKLLILLVLILSLTFFAFACGTDPEPEATEAPGAQTDNVETPKEDEVHELHDYFILESKADGFDFSKVSQYEGELVDYDRDHNLMAIKTQTLDERNKVTDTVTIYDILTGEKLQEHSATYLLYGEGTDRVSFNVDISYPVVRVSKRTQSEEGEALYDVKYYFAKKGGELIRSTDKNDFDRIDYGNGLVSFNMGDDVVWVDRYMKEVRSVDAIAANGYDIDIFNSEYQGYLYTWDEDTVRVFNRLGVCSAIYRTERDSMLAPMVLDDGNVLVQELEAVDEDAPYDYVANYDGEVVRIKVHTSVMSYLDGKLTPVELGFVVDVIETAYSQRYSESDYSYLPFTLAEGRDNQAIIYRYSGGKLSLYPEYVVMSNDLVVEYTVKNSVQGVDIAGAAPISPELYVADVIEGAGVQAYIFDLDGNKITPYSADLFGDGVYVTENYIINYNGVYDLQMNLLYDIRNSEFAGGEVLVDELLEKIYLTKHNYQTDADECYVLDVESKKATLLCDGKDTAIEYVCNGFYALRNTETDVISFFNAKDEVKLVVLDMDSIDFAGDVVFIEAVFEGKPIIYVVE